MQSNATSKLTEMFSKKRVIFILLFSVIVLVCRRINFSPVIGVDNQFFTLFQFFAPIAGSFLGPVFGAFSVLIAETADYILVGKGFDPVNLIRLTPMLFAAYYFGAKNRANLSIAAPIAAMALFILHPVGREVWYFSLYWTIPIIGKVAPKKYTHGIIPRSLGATFTAHAVGTAAWIWTVPMTAEQWIVLIPVVAYERLLFAAGIAASYVIMNTVLDLLVDKLKWNIPSDILHLDSKYSISRRIFSMT